MYNVFSQYIQHLLFKQCFLMVLVKKHWEIVVKIQQTVNGVCDILYTCKQLNAGLIMSLLKK